jgi:hypothetical protein
MNNQLQIPSIFSDNTTTIKNHSIKTHIFCILLRLIIGFLIINNTLPRELILILSALIVTFFTYKYFKLPLVWKVYLRTVLVYLTVFVLIFKYHDKYRLVCGTLIMVDSLMGLQSRHIFERLSLLKL